MWIQEALGPDHARKASSWAPSRHQTQTKQINLEILLKPEVSSTPKPLTQPDFFPSCISTPETAASACPAHSQARGPCTTGLQSPRWWQRMPSSLWCFLFSSFLWKYYTQRKFVNYREVWQRRGEIAHNPDTFNILGTSLFSFQGTFFLG